MNVSVDLTVDDELPRETILEIAKAINFVYEAKVVGGKGKQICTKKECDGRFCYSFVFENSAQVDASDDLAAELFNRIGTDFDLEIDSDIDEDFLAPYDEEETLTETSPSVLHSKWVSEQQKNGWRYGMDFNESSKTNPYIRPFYMLSHRQKQAISNSSKKLGHYGINAAHHTKRGS